MPTLYLKSFILIDSDGQHLFSDESRKANITSYVTTKMFREAVLKSDLPESFVHSFMKDSYKERTFEDLEDEYKGHREYNREHKRLPFNGEGTVADEYYGRKYTSEFMAEMNRSALYYIERYLEKE